MRPDRIVVGECRAGEALDMIQAMTTGHEGSLSTGHANTPPDMLRRLETMIFDDRLRPAHAGHPPADRLGRSISSSTPRACAMARRKIVSITEVYGWRTTTS